VRRIEAGTLGREREKKKMESAARYIGHEKTRRVTRATKKDSRELGRVGWGRGWNGTGVGTREARAPRFRLADGGDSSGLR